MALLQLWLLAVSILCADGIFYDPCGSEFYEAEGVFPSNFTWAIASAAYQIEGGWNADGKGKSIWDTLTQQKPSNGIPNNATGNIACDSYHKWALDVQLLKNIGVKNYRFSISWARILPQGTINGGINQAGIDYYTNLINNLTANGINPIVTLYHLDLPQALQDQQGWLNRLSVMWFKEYANLCFEKWGDKVTHWITINEPFDVAVYGYTPGHIFAPEVFDSPGTDPYIVGYNLLMAHANAYRTFKKGAYKGQIGISLNSDHNIPATMRQEDTLAAIRKNVFQLGWFAHPIFIDGDYPPLMKQVVGYRSAQEGLKVSRLAPLSTADKNMIKGSADFFGLNQYTSSLVSDAPSNISAQPNFYDDLQVKISKCKEWKGDSSWDKITPWGIRRVLLLIKEEYGNPPVLITENGFSDNNGSTSDHWRAEFFRSYISAVLKAYNEGCNVIGYTAWSFLDDFEWSSGYTSKFGLHYVNFSDPTRPRSFKDSAHVLASIVSNNGLPMASTTQLPTTKGTSRAISYIQIIFFSVIILFTSDVQAFF